MRRTVRRVANFVRAAGRDSLSRNEETDRHETTPFPLFRAEQVRCETERVSTVDAIPVQKVGVNWRLPEVGIM